MSKKDKKLISKYWITVIVFAVLTVVLNLMAFSKSFCDWYAVTVYRGINAVVGTLTGWCRIAIGEIIMYVGAALLVLLVILGIVRLILFKKKAFGLFYKKYAKSCLTIILAFLFVYTTNWLIPIRGNVLRVSDNTRTIYTNDEVQAVRDMVVLRLNEIAAQIDRDESGNVIVDYTQEEIFEIMRARSDEFPKLKGHYSPAKKALCSAVLDMMGIGGYNYIYTMEPTYNKYMSELYNPVAISHELCHHKGYYLENEATFISAVTLAESDDLYCQYCGYLEIYRYINPVCKKNYIMSRLNDPKLKEDFAPLIEYFSLDPDRDYSNTFMAGLLYEFMFPSLDETVIQDTIYAQEKSEEAYRRDVNEKVEEIISEPVTKIADKGWEVQGEILKENIYDGMVLMVLQYYYNE